MAFIEDMVNGVLDFFQEYGAHVIVVVLVGFIVGIFLMTICEGNGTIKEIQRLGYDVKEVKVFCRHEGVSWEDFLNSKGLRELYKNYFSQGIPYAGGKKSGNDSSSLATGMVVGMAISNSRAGK